MKRQARLSLVAALLLGACSGGGGGSSGGDDGGGDGGGSGTAVCETITGGTSQVVATSGDVSDTAAAADGDLETHATMNITPASPTAAIRATAQSGVVFAAGGRAGAFMTFQDSASVNITTINTYLSGVLQESSSTNQISPTSSGTGADHYIYFTTTKQYDSVELAETDNGASSHYLVYEICSNGQT